MGWICSLRDRANRTLPAALPSCLTVITLRDIEAVEYCGATENYTSHEKSETYHIRYPGSGSDITPGFPVDSEPGRLADGRPAAADP